MDKDTFTELLREAGAARSKDNSFRLEGRQGATLMLGGDGTLLTIDRVSRLLLKAGFIVAECERGERYFLDLARVFALRLEPPSEATGFRGETAEAAG
ncbi:MAG: hypothetical protein IPL40_04855 [Proteobacteria bacterium]|nr:hypothetical protein [Pseudomonadota bacterium]